MVIGNGDLSNNLILEIKRGIKREELKIVYQPIINVDTMELCGYEALTRWKKEHKVIMPEDFIPQLEKLNKIDIIDKFVVDSVFNFLKKISVQGYVTKPITINISKNTLLQKAFMDFFQGYLLRYSIDRSLLILEVTGRDNLEENITLLARRIRRLNVLGIKVVLDDLTIEMAKVLSVSKFEFEEVKINKNIDESLLKNSKFEEYVSTIKEIMGKYRVYIFVNGVETVKLLEKLNEDAFIKAQGYLTLKPVTEDILISKFFSVKN